MSLTKGKLLVLGIGLSIVIELFYLNLVYPMKILSINQTKETIELTKIRIETLEKNLERDLEINKQIESTNKRKQDILNKIPLYTDRQSNRELLFQYVELYDFLNISYQTIDIELDEERVDGVLKNVYELSFVGRETEVLAFVEQLNKLEQTVQIKSLRLDRTIQNEDSPKDEFYSGHYKEAIVELVEVTLEIEMYSRYDLSEKITQEKKLLEQQVSQIEEVDQFVLSIGGALTSGDGYKLSGPGETENYIGLSSGTEIKVMLEVQSDYYLMSIEDQQGVKDQLRVEDGIERPKFNIISTRDIETEMLPKVKVYIQNKSNALMEIEFDGESSQQVEIYSEEELMQMGDNRNNVILLGTEE